jgi:TatD DNase family protein
VIDTHAHLTFPDFADRVPAVLAEARAAGVSGVITISTTTQDCLEALVIAKAHDRVWCSAGVHPLYAHQGPHAWDHLRLVAQDARCVAWGELGLDNHYSNPPREVQHRVLMEQLDFIAACRDVRLHRQEGFEQRPIDKPIILHCREAFDDLLPILRATRFDPARFVFHCFTGTPADMRKILDFGAMVSFTGVATYGNAKDVREAVRLVPDDRLMVETDAPFLSPEPRRSERPCRPAFARFTAESLAATRGQRFEQLHEHLNRNTKRFFGIDDDPA